MNSCSIDITVDVFISAIIDYRNDIASIDHIAFRTLFVLIEFKNKIFFSINELCRILYVTPNYNTKDRETID